MRKNFLTVDKDTPDALLNRRVSALIVDDRMEKGKNGLILLGKAEPDRVFQRVYAGRYSEYMSYLVYFRRTDVGDKF